MSEMINKKEWEEFRASGLLWFINSILHLFGWAIVVEIEVDDEGKPTDKIIKAYPAKVKFRGFDLKSNDEGYEKVTKHLSKNMSELLKEVNDET